MSGERNGSVGVGVGQSEGIFLEAFTRWFQAQWWGWFLYTMLGMGMGGNLLSLFAFKHLYSTATAYLYQIVIIVIDLSTILLGFCLVKFMSLAFTPGSFVRNSYILMWITIRFFNTIILALQITGYLFTIGVCYDRYQAMSVPMKYKNFNQRKRCLLTFITSFAIGYLLTLPNAGNFYILAKANRTEGDDPYFLVTNVAYLRSTFMVVMDTVLQLSRVVIVVVLMTLVAILSRQYSNYQKAHKQPKKGSKQSELISAKSLTLLLLAQSMLVILGIGPTVINAVIWFAVGGTTGYTYYAEFMTMAIYFCNSCQINLNCLIYICMSKSFRRSNNGGTSATDATKSKPTAVSRRRQVAPNEDKVEESPPEP